MPALENPRYERLAQCIVLGLEGKTQYERSLAAAYAKSGYATTSMESASAAASRLLKRVKPITERVKELVAIGAADAIETTAKLTRELNEAIEDAKLDKQHGARVSAVATKAKILGLQVDRIEQGKPGDFTSAQTPLDIVNQHIKAAGLEPTKPLQDAVASVLRDAAASLAAVLERARDSQTIEH